MMLVRKVVNKWCLCMDFTNLNAPFFKDPYPMLDIDNLIDEPSSYCTLSFIDAYSRYNQILMDHFDAPKTDFMSNHGYYDYNIMPFDLKNDEATYQ